MSLQPGNRLAGFVLQREQEVPERNLKLKLFEHEKTGAQVLHVDCSDDNKVFFIGFRTPPPNSTGVPHILEHSVLAGSRKYRTKEPFVDLLKTSLKTFLNAFTAPDCTVYPVASRNHSDFRNLMDVYLDAVFFPLMRPETFAQEGWHHHLESTESPLELKGVVYNEMKGVYSNPMTALYMNLMQDLLPDTSYASDSGGDPKVIPELTYEQFCEFHKTHYHPSNSFTVLYGDVDVQASLELLDKQAFSHFERANPVKVLPQEPFTAPRERKSTYSIGSDDSPADKTFIGSAWGLGELPTREESLTMGLLSQLLMETEASPLRNALLASGLGQDSLVIYEGELRTKYLFMGLSESNSEKAPEVLALIGKTLTEIAEKGFDRDLLESVLARAEFRLRESDFGHLPRGMGITGSVIPDWTSDHCPLASLSWEKAMGNVRKGAFEEKLFERAIREKLLSNPHRLDLVLAPEQGLSERAEAELTRSLQAKKESLAPGELQKIVDTTKALIAFQEREDSPEDVADLPVLMLSDVRREADDLTLTPCGDRMAFIPSETSGIAHIRLSFGLDHLVPEEVPWASLLTETMTALGTRSLSHVELSQALGISTGGVSFSLSAPGHLKDSQATGAHVTLSAKFTYDNCDKALALLQQILLEQNFANAPRLKELTGVSYSQARSNLVGNAFGAGMRRSAGALTTSGRFDELAAGVDYFEFIKRMNEKSDDVGQALSSLAARVVARDNVTAFSFTSEPSARDRLQAKFQAFLDVLPKVHVQQGKPLPRFVLSPRDSAIVLPSQVQYVFMASILRSQSPSPALMRLVGSVLRLGHLWQEVRVKGGAYGARYNFDRVQQTLTLGSFRDPNLARTLEVYRAIPKVLAEFSPSDRDFESLKIGSFSELDMPLIPSTRLSAAHERALVGLSQVEVQRQREELFALTAQDVRGAAGIFADFAAQASVTVVGGASAIEGAKGIFAHVDAVAL